MTASEDVTEHIRGSLLDLRRRLDADVAIEVARAVMLGAAQALRELSGDGEAGGEGARAPSRPHDFSEAGGSKH